MSITAACPYLQITHPIVGRLFQPMVEATLSHGAIGLRHFLFLDSGADISLIPASLGVALGLHREGQQTTSVRGLLAERADLCIVEVYLQIGDTPPVPIRVGWADGEDVPLLLGRLDVFDRFTFEFNHERRMVIVRQ